MKPRRPTENDLLAIVQNGFESQLPKDLEAQAPAPGTSSQPVGQPAAIVPLVPMVRITLTIPEELRYRLKMAVMTQRRATRDRLTQDEFCAHAIAAHLDKDERGRALPEREDQLAAFLRDCLNGKGLTKNWVPKAKALLATLQPGSGPAPTPPDSPPGP